MSFMRNEVTKNLDKSRHISLLTFPLLDVKIVEAAALPLLLHFFCLRP